MVSCKDNRRTHLFGELKGIFPNVYLLCLQWKDAWEQARQRKWREVELGGDEDQN